MTAGVLGKVTIVEAMTTGPSGAMPGVACCDLSSSGLTNSVLVLPTSAPALLTSFDLRKDDCLETSDKSWP